MVGCGHGSSCVCSVHAAAAVMTAVSMRHPVCSAAVQASLTATNMYRTMNGKPALTDSSALDAFADTGAMTDFTTAPHTHFMNTSGGGIAFAENECPVQGNWMLQPRRRHGDARAPAASPRSTRKGPGTDYSTHGHYINMMGDYKTLGTGVYQVGTGVTITQDYGN